MFIGNFVDELRRGRHIGASVQGAPHCCWRRSTSRRHRARHPRRFYYLSRSHLVVKDERPARSLRSGVRHKVFKGIIAPDYGREPHVDDPRRLAEARLPRSILTPEEMEKIEVTGRRGTRSWRRIEEASRRTEKPPPGRQQVDRHGRHLAFRQWRATTPKAYSDWRAEAKHGQALSRSGKSASIKNLDNDQANLGTRNIKMALRRLRRFAREGGGRTSLISTRRSTAPRAGLARRPHAPRAPQCGQIAAVPRHVGGSMDGHIRQAGRGTVQRRAAPSSSTSSISTSTTASTKACGRTIAAAATSRRHQDAGRAPQIWPRP